jgi:hypothetical protein
MLSGRAFRAQLVTQGQRELFDYWLQSAGRRRMPSRSDLDPFSVPKLLPCIGLIDVVAGLHEASFRLAGTRLRDIYGEEITGKRVDHVFTGTCADYWRRVHERVVEHASPSSGVVRGPAEGRDHILLFWMRLPLSQDGCSVDRILCYDTAGTSEPVLANAEQPWRQYRSAQPRMPVWQRRAHAG